MSTELIGTRIARLRRERGLAQYKLAALIRMHPASLNQIEKNKRTPKLETVKRIAPALGVSYEALIGTATSESVSVGVSSADIRGAAERAARTELRDLLVRLADDLTRLIESGDAAIKRSRR